ncbi:extracellular solute-binding protein family 5 [Clostridium sp. CAG:58]|uniref:ABC transporter substrate-binding protein n=1 Tax=Alitiscatomonas sp. TaxID=2981647 RepID=UPI000339F99A|nr:ABC transporter substrate-binding protein [Lachnospiraceae bacterium]CDC50184.1 extracellular solute-binding protein family 5 [Clostridium sp. CAG:58]
MKTKKVLAGFTAAAIAASMITGCGSGAKTETAVSTEAETTAAEEKETTAAETAQDTEKRKERILTVSGNGDFGFPSVYTISPKGQGYMTLSYIFDTLMWKDESGLIPYLAEDYSVSEDGLTYTFQLRKGVSFTDGTPFTAEDVKFTFDYMKEHPYKWVSVSMVEEASVVDEHTVEIKLNKTYNPFLSDVAGSLPILPKHIWENVTEPETFTEPEAAISTGPFILENYDSAAGTYTFKANEDYFYGDVQIDKLVIANVSGGDSKEALLSGEIAAAPNISYKAAMSLKDSPEYTVLEGPGLSVTRLYFNFDEEAMAVKEIRQAMYHAVNLDEVVEKAYGGAGYPGSAGHVQPGTPWYNPDVRQYAYDVETAKKMLSEAGAADSNGDGILEYNGEEMSYTLTFTENDEKLAELLVSYMKAVGIELVPQSADDATVKAAISEGNFELAFNTNGSFGGDPVFLSRFATVGADGAPSVTGQGGTTWESEEYNRIYNESAVEQDDAKRHQQVNELQEIIAEELPCLTLYYKKAVAAYNNTIFDGFYYTPDGISIAVPFIMNKLVFVSGQWKAQ